MEVKTYRAATMHEALTMVRRDLGPDAAVLHTREVRMRRLFGLVSGPRQIEVTASTSVQVPSRLPTIASRAARPFAPVPERPMPTEPPVMPLPRPEPSDVREGQLSHLEGMMRNLCLQSRGADHREWPDALFRLYADLIEVDVSQQLARELVEEVRGELSDAELSDAAAVRSHLARRIESGISVTGPIGTAPGRHRLVALVGPTGVGKTTTIAKLAANHRLKKHQNVGLITVDTYRVAAVEQLRTYADIIDLPMQVVSTPREMREAVRRLADQDLILMDTAGRSPRDEIKIQELKAFLTEAKADEVHLVLSSVAGERTLVQTAERFAAVGTTSLILTKLDEATGLGNLLPMLRGSRLPLSYLTNGQNVPDDIETAQATRLAQMILGPETAAHSF